MGTFTDLISMDLIEAAIGELEEETRIKRMSLQQTRCLEKKLQRVHSWQSNTTSNSLPAIEETAFHDEFWVVSLPSLVLHGLTGVRLGKVQKIR